jgi:hypothetical protein
MPGGPKGPLAPEPKQSTSPEWPLVRVRWVDSSSPRVGWVRLSEWEGVGSLDCVSVGYLIHEDERQKTLAPHLAYPDDAEQCQGNGIIVIPLGAIVSVEALISSRNVAPPPHPSACAAPDHSSDRPESVRPSVEHPPASRSEGL